jgi:hypothetical protein
MRIALLGIAHAFRTIRHRPCVPHYQASPMHFALSGIAHAFRIIRHRLCISHYQASPMQFALSGIAHAFRIVRHLYEVSESPMHFALSGFDISYMRYPCGILDRPCILHYQASPMHIALSGIAHAHRIIGHTTSSLRYSSPVKKGIEWYRVV